MYIGQTTVATNDTWIYNQSKGKMEKKKISYAPGLFKLFDEVLVNAADNLQRGTKKQAMSYIDISVEIGLAKKNLPNKLIISVKNDGHSIPMGLHPKENIHVSYYINTHSSS